MCAVDLGTLGPQKILELARQAEFPNETVVPVVAALARALESSEKDGSIVLSAGLMFVTAEVMAAWQKRQQKSPSR